MSISFTGEVPRGDRLQTSVKGLASEGPSVSKVGPTSRVAQSPPVDPKPLGTSPVKEIDTETGGEEKKCRKSSYIVNF